MAQSVQSILSQSSGLEIGDLIKSKISEVVVQCGWCGVVAFDVGDSLGLSLPLVWGATLRVEVARVRVTTTTTTRLRELSTAPAHKNVVRHTAHPATREAPNRFLANEQQTVGTVQLVWSVANYNTRVRARQGQHSTVGDSAHSSCDSHGSITQSTLSQ